MRFSVVWQGTEELRHCLIYTTLELQSTILSAQEEIARKDDELSQLTDLLTKTIKERDDAQAQYQKLLLQKLTTLQQQQQQQHQEDHESNTATNLSSSDCDESIISSPGNDPILRLPLPPPPPPQLATELPMNKPLPKRGKFLQAVMEAGPLLQTLLLAGPLPQWQHPPPPLDSIEIPPVTATTPYINTNGFSKKRGIIPCEPSDNCSPKTKYQRVVLH